MHGEPTQQELNKAGKQLEAMHAAIEVLRAHVEATCGLFMDSRRGWETVAATLELEVQRRVRVGMPRELALKVQIAHGEGEPSAENVRHVSTFGERIAACSAGGFNEVSLSGLCLVSIHSHWEDKTRGDIAKALGVQINGVKSGLFADINRMRNALLHAGGRVESTKPFEVLKWFERGDVIVLNPDRFHELISHIRDFPQGLHLPGWEPFKGKGAPMVHFKRG